MTCSLLSERYLVLGTKEQAFYSKFSVEFLYVRVQTKIVHVEENHADVKRKISRKTCHEKLAGSSWRDPYRSLSLSQATQCSPQTDFTYLCGFEIP